jgi:SAM-dependent methyltransferase
MSDHQVFAAFFDWANAPAERAGLRDRRRRLLAHARGNVLEVGGGTGANVAIYRDVDAVTVLEPDAAMRRRFLDKLSSASVPVEVHEAGIEDAPFDDGSFDTVVSTFTLCSVPDQAVALGSIRRLLTSGGLFLFLEHVIGLGLRAAVQRGVAPAWRVLAGGCHPDRDTVGAVRAAGFTITDLDRFVQPRTAPITATCVQGLARS